MIREDFGQRISDLEAVLQKVATDIASGVLSERLPPMDLWNRAEASVTLLKMLAESCRETMTLLKPESALSVETRFKAFTQPLSVFRDILFQKTNDPLANSRLALEQLRKAMTDGSDFLILAREIRDNPSPVIQEILRLKEESGGGRELTTISTPPTLPQQMHLIRRIETLKFSVFNLEKALSEVKERLSNLEESLKATRIPPETEASMKESQKKQMSLSQF